MASPSPKLAGVNIRVGSGVTVHAIDRSLAEARALHAKVVRLPIVWSTVEPLAQGQIDQAALALVDHVVAQAAADGLGVVALADGTPCWASSAPAAILRDCVPARASAANAWPPRDPAAYGAFTAMLAQRYGARLAAIEVWNEPDQANEAYFAGPHKPERYAAVLRAAYTAIKRVDPHMPVLGGSLVGSNGRFLSALYAAGIRGYYDGLSVHFYNLVLASLRSIREVQRANGDSKPLWLNEFGWSSCWPRWHVQQEQACVTRQVQAADLRDTFRALARVPWVVAEIMYELQGSKTEDFGVLTETGARKPGFAALREAFVSPLADPTRVTVRISRQGGRLVASGSGPVGDYLQLEARRSGTLLYRALFRTDRFNRYVLPLPAVLGVRDLQVSVFQYWSGPATAAHARV